MPTRYRYVGPDTNLGHHGFVRQNDIVLIGDAEEGAVINDARFQRLDNEGEREIELCFAGQDLPAVDGKFLQNIMLPFDFYVDRIVATGTRHPDGPVLLDLKLATPPEDPEEEEWPTASILSSPIRIDAGTLGEEATNGDSSVPTVIATRSLPKGGSLQLYSGAFPVGAALGWSRVNISLIGTSADARIKFALFDGSLGGGKIVLQ